MLFNFLYLDLSGYILLLCVFIPVWVFLMLCWQLSCVADIPLLDSEDNLVELVWTVLPTLLVSLLCFLNLQCLGCEGYRVFTGVVKVVGHQWFWSYDVVDGSGSYDSLMLDFIDSVDKPLRLSYLGVYSLLITSADVIHSFAVPAYNLKVDAIPGRVNQILFCPDRLGVFVGYCSELCGAGHAYMPIVMEVVMRKSLS
uniref:cytochrome-c oxidase n=1 Tax=Prosthogonimus cuneatus TaxID=232414 RepID=A0A7L7RYC3_9TREM|nr:cytochrome c oxidase subunit II [Prosthogonimus cuneatus]QNU39797.1 cytochrome c oxidase subunit II [Prosthogonimus cuneatus]